MRAPLYSDSYALCEWLIGRLGRTGARRGAAGTPADVLPRLVCQNALDLLGHVVLALKGIDRDLHIDDADAALVQLRVQLRLAGSTDYLTQEQLLHALTITDRIGRQLGGWQQSLDAA